MDAAAHSQQRQAGPELRGRHSVPELPPAATSALVGRPQRLKVGRRAAQSAQEPVAAREERVVSAQRRCTHSDTSGSAGAPIFQSRTPQEVVSCGISISPIVMPSRTSGRLRRAAPSRLQPVSLSLVSLSLCHCHRHHPFATRARLPHERAAVPGPGVRREQTGQGAAG
jgi:hypothetical protein